MKSNIFKKAHELTKKIIKAGDNYKATFRLCLTFVYSQLKKGVNKMVELKGTEKQIKFAKSLLEKMTKNNEKKLNKKVSENAKVTIKSNIEIATNYIESINDAPVIIANLTFYDCDMNLMGRKMNKGYKVREKDGLVISI